jgi:hypothetical protein
MRTLTQMNKQHTTVGGRKIFNRQDLAIHDLADLITRRDPPARLLRDLGIRRITERIGLPTCHHKLFALADSS